MSIAGGASYGLLAGSILAVVVVGFSVPIAVPSLLTIGSGMVGGYLGYLWNRT